MKIPTRLKLSLIVLATVFHLTDAFSQCSGGTLAGTLVPTAAYQTVAITSNRYYQVSVSCGSTYNFTFCSNGGTAAFDTQITLLNAAGTTTLAYNDDNCGLQSAITYTATFSGTIRVLINQYNCSTSTASTGTLAYNSTIVPISAAFTLSANGCSNAISTITGSTGGVFALVAPVPAGTTINPTTGAVSNAPSGATVNVSYTVCSTSSTQSITLPSTNCWTLNGNATNTTIGGNNCIQLTAATNNQLGCAWNGSLIDFASSFSLSLDYYFGNSVFGADGSTFTFQPNASTACGSAGGSLGAGGLTNALSIEFDTYDNDNPAHIFDILADHIAVEIDGNHSNGPPFCGPVPAKPGGGNIDDGVVYPVNIQWNAPTQTLSIYFNGALRLTCTHDFVTNVFGGNSQVYWGATAATGGLNNQQYFCPQTVIVLPTELSSFASECVDESTIRFDWTTVSERDLDYFQLEETKDGVVFHPLAKVEAAGMSNSAASYSVQLEKTSSDTRYYRIKLVDNDGSIEFTELITAKNCISTPDLISVFTLADEYLQIESTEPISFVILNQLGQQITRSERYSTVTKTSVHSLAAGIYYLQCVGISGKTAIRKFVITAN